MVFDRIIAVRNNKTVYRDGNRCLKVFGNGFSMADILNEALNQAIAAEAGLRVPKILEVTIADGELIIVSEYVKGKTLAQLMRQYPEKKEEYLNFFVDLQLEVLKKNCPMLRPLHEKMKMKLGQADLRATVRFDLIAKLEAMPREKMLCHGDFNPTNIIVSDDGTPTVIDWSHAAQGSAAADAARTYLLLCLNGEETEAERYLELFCKKSGTAVTKVREWMPIVAAAQSVKGSTAECEFLQKWY